MTTTNYAGDLVSTDAYQILESEVKSVLIDVRTDAEWTFVGVADLESLGKRPILLEWQVYPDMEYNTSFVEELDRHLGEKGVGKDASLLFLCRSGQRSKHAAIEMTAKGYTKCINVSDGFEGGLDDVRHRGAVSGWKAVGLPWVQH